MAEISMQQVYELACEVLRDFDELNASLDELLEEMRDANRDMSFIKESFPEASK